MKKCLVAATIFVLCWLAAWVGGFNFDQRNSDVGAWFVLSVLFAAVGANAAE